MLDRNQSPRATLPGSPGQTCHPTLRWLPGNLYWGRGDHSASPTPIGDKLKLKLKLQHPDLNFCPSNSRKVEGPQIARLSPAEH